MGDVGAGKVAVEIAVGARQSIGSQLAVTWASPQRPVPGRQLRGLGACLYLSVLVGRAIYAMSIGWPLLYYGLELLC